MRCLAVKKVIVELAIKVVSANTESTFKRLDGTLDVMRFFAVESVFLFVKDFIVRDFGKTKPNLFDGGLPVAFDARMRRGAGYIILVNRQSALFFSL
jgi:hypothetical protein